MKKQLLLSTLFVAATHFLTAQVGINTSNPDPNSDLTLASANKGLLLNRVALTGTDNASPLSEHKAGMTVYNTASVNDITPGIYYNDGSKWVRTSQNEPWKVQNTGNQAVSNTENIYQQGKVAVGFSGTDPVSDKQLEVKGSIKSQVKSTFGLQSYHIFETDLSDNSVLVASNNTDINAATERSSLVIRKDQGAISSVRDGSFSNLYVQPLQTDLNVTLSGNRSNRFLMGQRIDGTIGISLTDSSNPMASTLKIDADKGVQFFYENSGPVANYAFPKNNGSLNQILVTDGAAPSTTNPAQLVWKNISDLMDTTVNWNLNGNSVNTGAFLGTTNNQELKFKYNNLVAGRLHDNYTAYGVGALSAGTAINGVAIGANALAASISTTENVGVGFSALKSATTGGFNNAVGSLSLSSLTTGTQNVAVGQRSMLVTTTGSNNTAIGSDALRTNSTSMNNVAVGRQSSELLASGNLNTTVGSQAMRSITNFSRTVAIGYSAGDNANSTIRNIPQVNNTYIGANTTTDNVSEDPLQFATAIGSGTVVSTSNSIILGRNTGLDKVGIGVSAPTQQFHVRAASPTSNPVRIEGLQPGSNTDKILVIDSTGILKQADPVSVLKSANGSCFKLMVDNSGALSTSPITCP